MGVTSIDSRVIQAPGPRAAEAALLELVDAARPRSPEDLWPPVRIVVPSASLRRHVAAALVRHHGHALAGVTVQTLFGLAREVLERANAQRPEWEAPVEIVVRRLAAAEDALHRPVAHLEDPHGGSFAAVRDLLDAGLTPEMEEPLLEAVAEVDASAAERARAAALVRVAARTLEALDALGWERTSGQLARARELLAGDPDLMPSRTVLVHGFADVTGVAADLLATVLGRPAAAAVLDWPPDPAHPGRTDAAARWGRPLRDRLGALGRVRTVPPAAEPELRLMAVDDPEAEVRSALDRAAAVIAAGVPPERIAMVARDVAPYAALLRALSLRLGVPLSGVGASLPAGLAGAAVAAFTELVRRGGEAPTDGWLELLSAPIDADLRLGLRTLGAARLEDVPGTAAASRGGVRLPLSPEWSDEDEDGDPGRRRRLPGDALARTGAAAGRTLAALASWPARVDGPGHAAAAATLLEHLGEPAAMLAPAVAAAGRLPAGWQLERDEWLRVLAAEAEGLCHRPLGGVGGGVQVLGAMEARGRTFDELLLLGLNRDLFPRTVREDALLPDRVRAAFGALLPDLPLKGRGWDEERWLFASLLAAAPRVTVLYSRADADGRTRPPSSFVQRLELETGRRAAPAEDAPGGPLAPGEAAAAAGAAGDHEGWQRMLATALAVARAALGPGAAPHRTDPDAVAAARRAVLAELDRGPGDPLGPYHGLLGPGALPDPDARPLAVTRLEAYARCPWRAFVRALGVLPPPDPLLALPGTDPLAVGQVVHRVLERLVLDALGGGDAALVRWPSHEDLERLLQAAAREVAHESGAALPGVGRLLAARARPMLEVAARVDWSGGALAVADVERETVLEIAGARLTCRADRVDTGRPPRVTDYKTGRPLSKATTESSRAEHLAGALARGEALQAAAYAVAWDGVGRYLSLHPDERLEDEVRQAELSADVARPALEAAVAILTAGWRAGVVPPRVEKVGTSPDQGEPPCRHCEVAAACLRSDTGFRRRLVRAMAEGAGIERPALAVWWIGREGAPP